MALAAILVAAFLRHTLHVYGGVSPDDIRTTTLLLVAATGIVVVSSRLLRQVGRSPDRPSASGLVSLFVHFFHVTKP
jgi:hypothetical protein